MTLVRVVAARSTRSAVGSDDSHVVTSPGCALSIGVYCPMTIRNPVSLSIIWRSVCAVTTGVLMACAFPPLEDTVAAWFALIPLLFVIKHTRPWLSFMYGALAGVVFWLATLSWLLRLSAVGGPVVVVVLAWMVLSIYCAAYLGAFCMVSAALMRAIDGWLLSGCRNPDVPVSALKDQLGRILEMVTIPLVWVGFEYLRSVLFSGFPWNALGISQYRNLGLIQMAEYGGVYLVSALIVVVNVALSTAAFRIADVYFRKRRTRGIRMDLLVALITVALCTSSGLRTVESMSVVPRGATPVRIAAVQPNVRQTEKWSLATEQEVYDTLFANTDLAMSVSPDMVVWPETAMPGAIGADERPHDFAAGLASRGVYLLAGAMEIEWEDGDGRDGSPDWGIPPHRLYNSSFLFDRSGAIVGRYRKQHLVPFGEYLPFDKTLTFLQRLVPIQGSCYPGRDQTVFDLPVTKADGSLTSVAFSSLICFEDIFPSLSRLFVRKGARLLINQTNDAWFDGSFAHVQHMSHCVFRCVENRVPAVRVTNTGVTCLIRRSGAISGMHMENRNDWGIGVLRMLPVSVSVEGVDMPLTFYTRYGDAVFALPCGIVVAAAFVLVVIRERRQGCGVRKAACRPTDDPRGIQC